MKENAISSALTFRSSNPYFGNRRQIGAFKRHIQLYPAISHPPRTEIMEEIENTSVKESSVAKAVPELAVRTLSPAADELGKGLVTAAKVVNIALSPLAGVVWGYEKIQGFVENKVAEKLEGVPSENVQTPPAAHCGTYN